MMTMQRTLIWSNQHDDRFVIAAFRKSLREQFRYEISDDKTKIVSLFTYPSMEEAIAEAEREVKSIYAKEEAEAKRDE